MTRTFTAAEMVKEAIRLEGFCTNERDRTAAMLRQAADEKLESERLHAAICQAVVLMNNGTQPFGVDAHRILREALASTTTEPTPPPAAAGPPRKFIRQWAGGVGCRNEMSCVRASQQKWEAQWQAKRK